MVAANFSTVVVLLSNFVMMSFFYYLVAMNGNQSSGSRSLRTEAPQQLSHSESIRAQIKSSLDDHIDTIQRRMEAQQGALLNSLNKMTQTQPVAGEAPKQSVQGHQLQRNAVLGLAKGIDFVNVYRFCRSLRDTSSSVDIILFIDEVFVVVAHAFQRNSILSGFE